MQRRDFFKLCSLAGLGVVSTQFGGAPVAHAADGFGKFVVLINAGGGWDHHLFVDPKGNVPNGDGWFINEGFAPDDIPSVGNISYAPIGDNAAFFNRFGSYATVFRGVDAQTASHTTGQRVMWSGRMPDNSPCFAALLAAAHAGNKPLAFITNGGYDSTAEVKVAKTRLGGGQSLLPLLFPNDLNPDAEGTEHYHTPATAKRIGEARQARLDAMRDRQNLPVLSRSMGLLYTSRLGLDDLKAVKEFLPDDFGPYSNLGRQAAIALAGWKAGLCQVATMSMGGYDTHSQNDGTQETRFTTLVEGVNALVDRAEELGIADELFIIMGSEFGRTPKYNEADGKDHWSVNANVLLDLSGEVPGNRVIGATDEFGNFKKINPNTLEVDANGVAMTPGHIHQWLRKFTKVDESDAAKLFPVSLDDEMDFG